MNQETKDLIVKDFSSYLRNLLHSLDYTAPEDHHRKVNNFMVPLYHAIMDAALPKQLPKEDPNAMGVCDCCAKEVSMKDLESSGGPIMLHACPACRGAVPAEHINISLKIGEPGQTFEEAAQPQTVCGVLGGAGPVVGD